MENKRNVSAEKYVAFCKKVVNTGDTKALVEYLGELLNQVEDRKLRTQLMMIFELTMSSLINTKGLVCMDVLGELLPNEYQELSASEFVEIVDVTEVGNE